MGTYKVWAIVSGSRYLGTVDADSEEEANEKAKQMERYEVFLCPKCQKEIMKAEVVDVFSDEVK